ncbi:hypothetical protein ACFLXJ_06110 [Chloroflexota bacterium]
MAPSRHPGRVGKTVIGGTIDHTVTAVVAGYEQSGIINCGPCVDVESAAGVRVEGCSASEVLTVIG